MHITIHYVKIVKTMKYKEIYLKNRQIFKKIKVSKKKTKNDKITTFPYHSSRSGWLLSSWWLTKERTMRQVFNNFVFRDFTSTLFNSDILHMTHVHRMRVTYSRNHDEMNGDKFHFTYFCDFAF